MNAELKALIDLVFDSEEIILSLVKKQNYLSILSKVMSMVMGDVPSAALNWSDLSAELKALPGSVQETDLSAYVEQKFQAVLPAGKGSDAVHAILKLVVDVAQDSLAVAAVFQS